MPNLKKNLTLNQAPFLSCGPEPLGFYPVVDSSIWVLNLLQWGVKTIQLRLKNKPMSLIEQEIKKSIHLTKGYPARLFINDYWQLALRFGAYGVHLGQEDINTADCDALQKAGLRLGVSTHSDNEIERVIVYQPSYIACGPIFFTDTKVMPASPQGVARLRAYCQQLDCPVVAIGGIKWHHLPEIWHAGVDGVAVVTAITKAKHVEQEVGRWLRYLHGLNAQSVRITAKPEVTC